MKPLHGTFHLPRKTGQKFGGIVRRRDGALELEAVGWDTAAGKHEVIVGLLADGSPVTLVEAGRTVTRMGVHGPRPQFRVWHMLIGWAFRDLAAIRFTRASASFTDLSAWWSWRAGFRFSDGSGLEGPVPVVGPAIRMAYDRAPGMTARLPDATIEMGPREAQSAGSRRYEIETSVRATIDWTNPQSMKRMYADLDALEALLWTILDQPSLTRGITAENRRLKARAFGGRTKITQPIEIRNSLRTARGLRGSHALFPRPEEIAPHFDTICNGWLARWPTDRAVLGALAEAATESTRAHLMSRPVQLTWYIAHAKSLDAAWLVLNPAHKGKTEHIAVLRDLFRSHGPLLFPDPAKAPDWDEMAIEMYAIRNDAGHGKVKPRRAFTMNAVERGQDLTIALGRIVLLELAGLPRATAVDWVKQGHRWQRFRDKQDPGGTL